MLTTVTRVKSFMSFPEGDTITDGDLLLQIMAASQAIESRCKRSFRKQSYSEKINAAVGSKYIVLRNYPVFSIEKISIPSGDITDFDAESDNLVSLEGMVFRVSGWPSEERSIKVNYTAGYVLPDEATKENPQTLPEALEFACIMLIQQWLSSPIGVKSSRVGDISVTYADDNSDLPPTIMALINPYIGRWV